MSPLCLGWTPAIAIGAACWCARPVWESAIHKWKNTLVATFSLARPWRFAWERSESLQYKGFDKTYSFSEDFCWLISRWISAQVVSSFYLVFLKTRQLQKRHICPSISAKVSHIVHCSATQELMIETDLRMTRDQTKLRNNEKIKNTTWARLGSLGITWVHLGTHVTIITSIRVKEFFPVNMVRSIRERIDWSWLQQGLGPVPIHVVPDLFLGVGQTRLHAAYRNNWAAHLRWRPVLPCVGVAAMWLHALQIL